MTGIVLGRRSAELEAQNRQLQAEAVQLRAENEDLRAALALCWAHLQRDFVAMVARQAAFLKQKCDRAVGQPGDPAFRRAAQVLLVRVAPTSDCLRRPSPLPWIKAALSVLDTPDNEDS